MSEQPVGAEQGEAPPPPAPPTQGPTDEAQLGYLPYYYALQRPRAKAVTVADLLPAVALLLTLPVLGMAVAWLWARLAPGQRVRIFPNNELVPLTAESFHRFDAMAVYLMLCLGAGVATGVGVWMLREMRGPLALLAAAAGGTGAALLAFWLGSSWAAGRYSVSGTPAVGEVISRAPHLDNLWVIIVWPLAAALSYGVLAAWNGNDDLGRRLG